MKKRARKRYAKEPGYASLPSTMYEELKLRRRIQSLEPVFEQFSEHRTGQHKQYELVDAGMGACAVFFTQSPSFLAPQRDLKSRKGRSNAANLFELRTIPSDNQIRNLLDPISPTYLERSYRHTFQALKRTQVLQNYRSFANQFLVALDGTEYFSSKKGQCEQCSQRILKNGESNDFHSVLTPVLGQPGNAHVIRLEPEYLVPQDGHEKQEGETQAGKRWVEQQGDFYAQRGVTMLGDDLYSRQPFCQILKDKGLHCILVCKPDSQANLYETVEFLAAQRVVRIKVVRKWLGRYAEIHPYRYATKLPLRGDPAALEVNGCELSSTHEETGELLYQNALATDFEVSDSTVEAIVRDGRARWKVENENNKVLKTKGYHLEHNFGHGHHYVASLLLSRNLLAFRFHTLLDLVDEQYRMIRQALGRRQTFFHDRDA